MTDATNRVLRQALELDPEERAVLAEELLASLEASEDDVQRAWAAEIERRSRIAVDEHGEDWRVVLERSEPQSRSSETRVTWPDVEVRARHIVGERVIPNLVLLERGEETS